MGLVRTHDVRESLLLQKVRHGLVPEADRAAAAEAVAVPGLAVHAVLLLLLGRRIRPDAIRRDLLIIVLLVLVRGIDPRDLAHVQYVLDPPPLDRRVRDGTGYAAVDAEDVLIDDRGQRHAIEGRIRDLPHLVPEVVAEPVPALVYERPGSVMLLPAVHVARLVIAPEEENLVGEHELHRQQVRHHLQARHAPVDVIPQEDEVPGREGHAEVPYVVREEVQVLEIAVYVPEDVRGTLEEDASRLVLEYAPNLLVQLDEVLRELLRLQVPHVLVGASEHVLDAVDERLLRGQSLVGEGVEYRLGGDGGVAAHSRAFCQELCACVRVCVGGGGIEIVERERYAKVV